MSSVALSHMRRPMHDGQPPRLLHAKGTRSASPQRRHCATKKPYSKSPHVANASISSAYGSGGRGLAILPMEWGDAESAPRVEVDAGTLLFDVGLTANTAVALGGQQAVDCRRANLEELLSDG
ncbi:MAG: hypothetical protein ACRBN8_39105 [Nannocystales bacterium]